MAPMNAFVMCATKMDNTFHDVHVLEARPSLDEWSSFAATVLSGSATPSFAFTSRARGCLTRHKAECSSAKQHGTSSVKRRVTCGGYAFLIMDTRWVVLSSASCHAASAPSTATTSAHAARG